MAYISLPIFLLYSIVLVKSQNEVMCYNTTSCGDHFEMSTMEDCCDNRIAPSGLSYSNFNAMECNNCSRVFGFFNTTYYGKEHGEPHSVLVGTISGTTPSSLNVTVALNRITAGEDDMALYTTNFTFSAGRDPLPVSFMFINDSISQEEDERFSLTLTLAEEIEGYELHLVLNGTILDDDIVVFKLSKKQYREDESNAMMPVKITKEPNVWLANPVTFRISPLTIDDAMSRSLNIPVQSCALERYTDSPVLANAKDFNSTDFTVSFPADEGLNILTDVDAFIGVVDDDINENGEQMFVVVLEVVNASDNALVDNTKCNLTICRIIDNDPLVIGFERKRYEFDEPDEIKLVQVFLVKDRQSEQTFRIAINIFTDRPIFRFSNATFEADFEASNLSVLFPSTSDRIHYTFSLLPDPTVEGGEEFIAVSSPSEGSVTYRIPDQQSKVFQSTSIVIRDNDSPSLIHSTVGDVEVGFEQTLYSVDESARFMLICVILTKISFPDIAFGSLDLSITTIPGSADKYEDFYSGRSFLRFRLTPSSGYQQRKCVYIAIIDNNALENVESFTSSLSLLRKRRITSVIISQNITKIDIVDDDDAVIGFINAPYTVNEFDGMVTMTVGVLHGSIQTDLALSISLFNGSAIAISDYLNDLSNGGMIILNGTNPRVNVSFSLVDDSVIEVLENLSAGLNFSGAAHPRVSLDPASAEVIILGDNDPVVGFVNAPYTVNEYDRKVNLMVAIRTDNTSIEVHLLISLTSGTANASSDYLDDLSENGYMTLNTGNPIGNVSFSLVDDLVDESREHFFANLEIIKPIDSSVTLILASAGIIILGDEGKSIIITYQNREYFVDECNCTVTMEVGFLSDGEGFAISLNISLLAETAIVSSDYLDDLSDGGLIVLNAKNSALNISFSLVDDSVVENLETLSAKLIISDNADQLVLGRASALINIQDNDEVAFGFEETKYLVNESAGILKVCGGITNIQDGLLIAVSITAEISLQARAGSADDKDFKEPPLNKINLTLLNLDHGDINSQRMCFNITIINDEIREDIESFTLEISVPSHLQIIAWPDITVISILDDDVATIGFFDASYSFGENDSKAFLQFGVLSGDLQINISVQVNISQRSTLFLMEDDGDELYVLNADQPSINVSFTLVNDNIYEFTELVMANLSFVGDQPARVTIANGSTEIYILDDEVLDFRFVPGMYSISKDDVNISLSLRLVSGNLGDIGVILRASIANSSIFHEITFEGNSVLKLVELPILPYDTTERPMDFKVELSLINYTNGESITNQDKERILLGEAEVTIRHPLPIPIINGATLGSVALLIIVAIIYVLSALFGVMRRGKNAADQAPEHENTRLSFCKDQDEATELKLYRVQSSFKLKISQHLMINSCNLEMKETVGQGQYGIVYRGYLSKGFTNGVAVKTLKGFLDKSLVRGLLEECSRMSTFDHPNVLTLIGVCVDGGPVPYIVMPFMFNGNLVSYLTRVRNEIYFSINSEMDEKIMQCTCKLMDFCLQIATGMEYLTSKMIIHRDLAARNCMIDLHFVVKVSDFGLSESINPSKDYFRQQEKGVKLPFKWMAPESLGDGIFSEKTDVWSYGVTCWEVFSAGKSPYAGVNATDLCPMLENGYRMDRPNNAACSDIMYNEVIQKCWELKPENRPNFSDLIHLVSLLLETNAGYTCFNGSTILEKTTITADADIMKVTAQDCGESKTVQLRETTSLNNEASYMISKF